MTRFDGKTTRRRLKKLRVDEISLVDSPAHAPARVAIMKRADQPIADDARGTLQDLAHGVLCKFAERDARNDESTAQAYTRLWTDPRVRFLVDILSS